MGVVRKLFMKILMRTRLVFSLKTNGFVMNAWADQQNLRKVKVLPDGNGDFTRAMGMLVEKKHVGFG